MTEVICHYNSVVEIVYIVYILQIIVHFTCKLCKLFLVYGKVPTLVRTYKYACDRNSMPRMKNLISCKSCPCNTMICDSFTVKSYKLPTCIIAGVRLFPKNLLVQRMNTDTVFSPCSWYDRGSTKCVHVRRRSCIIGYPC